MHADIAIGGSAAHGGTKHAAEVDDESNGELAAERARESRESSRRKLPNSLAHRTIDLDDRNLPAGRLPGRICRGGNESEGLCARDSLRRRRPEFRPLPPEPGS